VDESEELAALRKDLNSLGAEADATKHEALLDAIGGRHRHRIRLVERADPRRRFTCVMYALKLRRPPAPVTAIAGLALGRVYLSPHFLTYAVAKKVLEEIGAAAAATGDLVVYASDEIQHIGIVDGGAVRSKWGCGHLWRHPVLEVPESYGSCLRYFRPPTRRAALSAFYDYARTRYDGAVDQLLRRPRPKALADRRPKRPL
jgi:hypothetical protein